METKDKAKAPVLTGTDYGLTNHGYTIPEGYEFVGVRKDFCDREEIVLRKKPKYPKTYEECCVVLFPNSIELGKVLTSGYKCELLQNLGKLLICRDAYWKIAGEEIAFGLFWEPDWTSGKPFYCISVSVNTIGKGKWYTDNKILAFPTEEMRDEFFENFKDLIEQCKELL